MIQPMSVSQNRRSPGRRSVWNATSSAIFTRKPRVHVHRALGPAGRAARVRDEQRVLAVDRRARRTRRAGAARSASVRSRPGVHRRVGAPEPRHDHDGVHASATCATAASAVSFIGDDLAAPREPVGGDERDRARVLRAAPRPRRRRSRRRSAGRSRRASRPRTPRRPSRAASAGTARPRRPRRTPRAASPAAMRSVSVRSSAQVSVRVAPSSPSQTTRVAPVGVGEPSTQIVADVAPAAGEPRRPLDAVGRVEHRGRTASSNGMPRKRTTASQNHSGSSIERAHERRRSRRCPRPP